jgi:hypothetical protein
MAIVKKAAVKKTVKKAQLGYSIGTYTTRDKDGYTTLDRFKNEKGEDRYYRSTGPDLAALQKQNSRKALMNRPDSVISSTLSPREREVMKSQENPMKKGGKIAKAKDGKWMQKAAASIKRRGTEGKCTPITKPGCTGKAKALAKTFKKIAAKRKSK